MHVRRKFVTAAFLLGTSLYILLPTADEVVIHPTAGLFLAYTFNLPYVYGVLLSIIIYRIIGLSCLLVAIAIGGKPTYYALKEKLSKKKTKRKL